MIKAKFFIDTKVDITPRIRKALESSRGSYVTIGVHDSAGRYSEGANPPTVVQVALWNEFGTKDIPERSFFRSAIYGNEAKINSWIQEGMTKMIVEGWTIHAALEMIGIRVQFLIQNKIKNNVPPPNAPATLAAKARAGLGSSQTLIESGLMLRSITYKVHVAGAA